MNIAFDATALLGTMGKNRGIGNYLKNQFYALMKNNPENSYFFINFYDEVAIEEIFPECNVKQCHFYTGKESFLLSQAKFENIIGQIIQTFLYEYAIDLFYITSPFEPLSFTYREKWFQTSKVVATIYDLIPLRMKKMYLKNKGDRNSYKRKLSIIDWIDHVFVISDSVKEDLLQYTQIKAEKITILYAGYGPEFSEKSLSLNEEKALLNKYGIMKKFMLCPGGDDPRKNLSSLVKSFFKLSPKLKKQYQLVIVCRLSDVSKKTYDKLLDSLQLENQVIFTNYISLKDLVGLYNLTTLVVFPSKYEGFGLPVVEAWACNAPVLTSNNSSLGEIGEGAAVLVNPFSIYSITKGLTKALTKANLPLLAKKGQEKLKEYNWDSVALKTIKSLNIIGSEKSLSNIKPYLAIFSPIPPLPSGIADYTKDLAQELIKYYYIDIFIDNDYKYDESGLEGVNIYRHSTFSQYFKRYDKLLFQVGNSHYHWYMMPYLKQYKGTIVLHDYNLHGLVSHYVWSEQKSFDDYLKFISYDYSIQDAKAILNQILLAEKTIYDVPLSGFVVDNANQVIVHSNDAKTKLLIQNPSRNVKKIQLYAPVEALKSEEEQLEIRRVFGYDENTLIISSFGYAAETKRVIPILKAFVLLLKDQPTAHLYFVGTLVESLEDLFWSIVEENNIKNHVTVTGYIDLEMFNKYLDITDVALNLRFPSNGETSGTLMRIFAKGKCAIINDIGSFSEIPEKICLKLPSVEYYNLDEEIELLFYQIKNLLNNKSLREEFGRNARAYAIDCLNIEGITKDYVSFLKRNSIQSTTIEDLNILKKEIMNRGYTENEILRLIKTLGYGNTVE